MECLGWTFVAFTSFVAFVRRSGWSLCSVYGALGSAPLLAITALIVFMGHWGWMFVASTAFVLFMECFWLEVCGVHSDCSVSEAFSLVFLFLFINGPGGALVAFTGFVAFMRLWAGRFLWHLECL